MATTQETAWAAVLEKAKAMIKAPGRSLVERYEGAAELILRAIDKSMLVPGVVNVLHHREKDAESGQTRDVFGYLIPFQQGYVALVLESGLTTVYRVLKFSPVNDDGTGGNDYTMIDRWEPAVAIPILPN
jgi:hypothetical protein